MTNVWVTLRVAAEKNKFSVPGTWRSVNYYPTSSPIAQALEKRGRGFWLCCEKEARGSDGSLANAREHWGALAALRRILLSTSSRCFYRLDLLLVGKTGAKIPRTTRHVLRHIHFSWVFLDILPHLKISWWVRECLLYLMERDCQYIKVQIKWVSMTWKVKWELL